MPDLGIRLQLLVGPTIPRPVPYDVVNALVELEVRNEDRQRDGFQMTFSLGRQNMAMDYGLLRDGLLDPPNRVIIMVFIGVRSEVLIDGIITNHQMSPSYQPGQSRLRVTGESISIKLDLEEKSETYENQRDSDIVTRILKNYAEYGLTPQVEQTSEFPNQSERITSQQGTDLDFIQQLARRNSFVFYIEPSAAPGVTTAFWGHENRRGQPQRALNINMGSATNIENINFGFNALAAVAPQVSVTDPMTRMNIPVPAPGMLQPSLSSQPASPLRSTVSRDAAHLNTIQAALRALVASGEGADASSATGTLDTAKYGTVLKSRRLVDLRGAGRTHDGTYYVRQVTHRIKRGEYKQNFVLAREGRGTSNTTVAQ